MKGQFLKKMNARKNPKRVTALFLAAMLMAASLLPYGQMAAYGFQKSPKPAEGTSVPYYNYRYLCIDDFSVSTNGIANDGDVFTYVPPSTSLNDEEIAILFWAALSLESTLGSDYEEAGIVINRINEQAAQHGLKRISPVTEADMKKIIHVDSVRQKYAWLDDAINNAEQYLQWGGLLPSTEGDSETVSGKPIPEILKTCQSPDTAYSIDKNTLTMNFDPSGADAEFIRTVPLEFSIGGSYTTVPPTGWTYEKTDASIIFSYSGSTGSSQDLLIRFNTVGTPYESKRQQSFYDSVDEIYNSCLELWICTECRANHVNHPSPAPLEQHQRLVFVNFDLGQTPLQFYASIGTTPDPDITQENGSVDFRVYRHEEDFTSTYNLQLYKYDHETGKPLEGSIFDLYERFDDKDQIDRERDGHIHIYEGGEPYRSYHTDNPVVWDGFRRVTSVRTDEDGYASHTVNHGYHYDKTFCDGHPAPQFVTVPEPEADPADPEGEGNLNQDEIDAALAENMALAATWLATAADCEAKASGEFDGVHFHWLNPEVDQDGIRAVAENGEAGEDYGPTEPADGESAFSMSGCEADRDQTYEKFTGLEYSYAFQEETARTGYTLHGGHSDDLPIEVITTNASESGAQSRFAGEYSDTIQTVSVYGEAKDARTFLLENNDEEAALLLSDAAWEDEEAEEPEEGLSLFQKIGSYFQSIISYFSPKGGLEEDTEEYDTASPSDASPSNASGKTKKRAKGTTDRKRAASPSNASSSDSVYGYWRDDDKATSSIASYAAYLGITLEDTETGSLFEEAYDAALAAESVGREAEAGLDDNFSHCDNADGEGNAWRIYDHRTEGELHINKQDMDLKGQSGERYDAYGDSNGDGTLEGAVYGLFAAEDILHPDGQTGTVYKANNLVSVATTDRDGNASFMVYTEAPGHFYDYAAGEIRETEDGWAEEAPGNLYNADASFDDYQADGCYAREYQDNAANNGNGWIGRPLLMGRYYVKELSRSEGYELSVGNRQAVLTNRGQDLSAGVPVGEGYVSIIKGMEVEGQITEEKADGSYGNPDYNEIFFTLKSQGTGTDGFDIILEGLPEGTKLYRHDAGTKEVEVSVGTGNFVEAPVLDEQGDPVYVVAEKENQYPRYNEDGSLMTEEAPANAFSSFVSVMPKGLSEQVIGRILHRAEDGLTEDETAERLTRTFDPAELDFFKLKVEAILRGNGKSTPSMLSDGVRNYSTLDAPVFDNGVREEDLDENGVTGVEPEEPAAYTVYGAPVLTVEIPQNVGGAAITMGDAILSVLEFFDRNPQYNYGGIHSVQESGDTYAIEVYAGKYGNGDFMVVGSDEETDSLIYHAVKDEEDLRYVYAVYSNDPDQNAFGTYRDYSGTVTGGVVKGTATLVTEAAVDPDGNLVSKIVTQTVYYQPGEEIRDADGDRVPKMEYVEETATSLETVTEDVWTEVGSGQERDGKQVFHMDSAYTDPYGNAHDDGEGQTYELRLVIPAENGMTVELTATDAEALGTGSGWQAGDEMGIGRYYLAVRNAGLSVSLDYENSILTSDESFVKEAELIYPGQDYAWQNGTGTPGDGNLPVEVTERPVRQKIKVEKEIRTYPDGGYPDNTYDYEEAAKAAGFRFKAYLKSNLERLYRNEEGNVTWLDRNGNELSYQEMIRPAFPETMDGEGKVNVRKIYTKVEHDTGSNLTSLVGNNVLADYQDPETKDRNVAMRLPFVTAITERGGIGILANAALYSYRGSNGNAGKTDAIRSEQNKGYTRILETVERETESGTGTVTVWEYNYEKFFDAMKVANVDKWDGPAQTYTSWRPIGNAANRTEYAVNNAKASDMVRQFAIQWYLEDEAAKLVKDNGQSEDEAEDENENRYGAEVYDEALAHALEKAYNYLAPFFAYDLDQIYAVPWDSAEDGGADSDQSTLSADVEETGSFSGTSAYLPYGTYLVVEQQPRYHGDDGEAFDEFVNRHYEIDEPKEVLVPTVYEERTEEGPVFSQKYAYDADMPLSEQANAENYLIRWGEEWDKNAADQREYVIRAHNASGDFEVYKYGLEPDKLTGTIHYPGGSYAYQGFQITQELYDPLKDYYNPIHKVNGERLKETEGANEDSHYYGDDGNHGVTPPNGVPYPADAIEERYHYASVSEQAGTAKNVRFGQAGEPEDGTGAIYRDVRAMQGSLTAYHGKYAPMLVPYSVLEPEDDSAYTEETGFAEETFWNRFYSTRLRIEKLDSETHENLLHDGALFMLYKAERDEDTGLARFWEEDTVITGSREFLKAMGASDITPLERDGAGELYSGVVKAGTPMCKEEDQIVLSDAEGNDVGQFEAFSTISDVAMEGEYGRQTTGYLDTPQALGAGVYVLCEVPPRGYVRTKPIAVEVYSDAVSYYKEGDRDERVHAAIYEYVPDGADGDPMSLAQIFVENVPIKLEVSKLKPSGTVTFRIGERIEGSLTEIGGDPRLEYVYRNGVYQGYAYVKGTLERLKALKAAGEDVEIVYDGDRFSGYGYVTRVRETDDDENPYVAGAKLTLYDAIELTPSGDSEDFAFKGLTVERDPSGNVTRMLVRQGYAGEKTELVKEVDENGETILTDYVVDVAEDGTPVTAKGYVWKEGTVKRPDTEILYYGLDGLSLTWTEKIDGETMLFGWDKDHQKVSIEQLEADKADPKKTDREIAVYAFQGGKPYLEFVGGDFTKLSYNERDHALEGDFARFQWNGRIRDWKMGEGTLVYHLDRDGNRDALADPYTGMAYVLEAKLDEDGDHAADRVLVWPVEAARDEAGNVVAMDKITTSRIAAIGEEQDGYQEEAVIEPIDQGGQGITDKPGYSHTESGYTTGTWRSEAGEESHQETTVEQNSRGQAMNEEALEDLNNGEVLKYMSPVYDEYGLVLYYQRSGETYEKGLELYDRSGTFIRYKDSDNLEEYNRAAYALKEHEGLYDGDQTLESQEQDKLYHRLGESYILENTWTTSDKTPNDPFSDTETGGQADLLKRLPAGTYILEELEAPSEGGYAKALPVGVTVEEDTEVTSVRMVDEPTKTYFEKIDGNGAETVAILDMDQIGEDGQPAAVGESQEPAAHYSGRQVSGAKIALYPAEYAADPEAPEGFRLEKTSDTPLVYETTDSRAGAEELETAAWTTGAIPVYAEGIPAGYYILEETGEVPEGFLRAEPVYLEIKAVPEVQDFQMMEDHTKVAVKKTAMEGEETVILPGAGFTLYEAELDENGEAVWENGVPQYQAAKPVASWVSDDATDYTDTIRLKDYANTDGEDRVTGFTVDFERMYEDYGVNGTGFSWSVERTAKRASRASDVWVLEDGSRVVISEDTVTFPDSMSEEDRDGFRAAYEDMLGEKRELSWAVSRTADVIGVETFGEGREQTYPAVAKVLLKVKENGKQVLADARYNGKEFTYNYKFHYEKLSQVNDYANMWLTADGLQRFDYLPVGEKLVLVETQVPEGFAQAVPVLVEVEETTGVQFHDVLNERRTLVISKVSAETGKELAGVSLALYRADEEGNLTESEKYLVDTWVSGEEGTYTETDQINGRIPDGFAVGDLRPHSLYDLPDGTYYLVERAALEYYQAMAPLRIGYTGKERIQVVRAANQPITGELAVTKLDEEGGSLNGVEFELSAFDSQGAMADGFPMRVTDVNGVVTVKDLPVGELDPEDGTITPYTYKLREQVPPEGFAVTDEVYTFVFDDGADSYGKDYTVTVVLHETQVVNEPTRLYLEKKDLEKLNDAGADGAFVEGAVMAVYQVREVNGEGEYVYQPEDLVARWTTSAETGRHLLTGLIAGQTYIWVEEEAPEGYLLMKPVAFTVSADGKKIDHISNSLAVVTVEHIQEDLENPDQTSIAAVTVKGRMAVRTEVAVEEEDGTEVLRFLSAGSHTLTEADGLKDGGLYRFVEHTRYSDGSDEVTGRVTRRVYFDEKGEFCYQGREAEKTVLTVREADEDGSVIGSHEPSEEGLELVIENGIQPENPRIVMKNQHARAGEPLESGQAVISTITWYNPGPIAQDVTVTAILGDGLELLDAYEGQADGTAVTWTIRGAAPYSQGQVSFAASVKEGAREVSLDAEVWIEGEGYSGTKTVPVLQANSLTVYNELTGSGQKQHASEGSVFTIRMWDQNGEELAGRYSYKGSQEGFLRSGEQITLAGNEYITIGLETFRDCTYEVIRTDDGKDVEGHGLTGAITPEGAGAWYTRWVEDTSERVSFRKGETYILEEATVYSDGEERISSRYSFTLDETASISAIGGYDQETKAAVTKADIATGEEIEGALLRLYDEDGSLVEEWISAKEPHEITGLKPEASYRLVEALPKDGYGYAQEIWFAMSEDGVVEQIFMEDKETEIVVSKKDITNGEELPGARLEIIDESGQVMEEWTSTEEPHRVTGRLNAGETYILRETLPANGFVKANDVTFTVNRDGSVDYVEMVDDTTKVKIYKNEFAGTASPGEGGEPVIGAVLQILDEDKEPVLYDGKEMIFTTGEDAIFLEKQLTSGKRYYLREITPAPGFAYAEDVAFTVSEDGSVDVVVMEDKPTNVSLSKREITGSEEIPGCEMILVDETGQVIERWTSTEEPHWIVGKLKAGETYRLIEERPAPGYAYSQEVTFTVSLDGTVDQVEMRDDVTKVEIVKVSKSTGKPLAGAEFELLDQDGTVVETWTSTTEPHNICGKLTAGERYTLRETKAPSGYRKMEDVTFTVNDYADVLTIVAENTKDGGGDGGREYTVRLKKVDEAGDPLPGASFEVLDGNGKPLSLMKEEDGTAFRVTVTHPQELTVREIAAPDGYMVLEKEYHIQIPASGTARLLDGDGEFYQDQANSYVFCAVNRKTPEIPETPTEPERPSGGKGWITAEFDWSVNGLGKAGLKADGSGLTLTKTGDDYPVEGLVVVLAFSVLGLIGVLYMKKKKDPKNKPPGGNGGAGGSALAALALFVCLTGMLWPPLVARAMNGEPSVSGEVQYQERIYLSDTDDPEAQEPGFADRMEVDGMTYLLEDVRYEVVDKARTARPSAGVVKVVTSAPFTDGEEAHVPDGVIEENGVTYYLSSYEVVETQLDARTEPVSDEIVYQNIPVGSGIPETAEIQATDAVTGEVFSVQVPLEEVSYGEEKWIPGFEFPITVWDYGEEVFDLNGTDVSLSETDPLKGYERELLDLIGVSEADYQITDITWDGGAYTDGGILCRKLKAVGTMRVVDCHATYSGVANLPAVSAKAVQAVYTDRPAATGANAGEERYTYTMKATAQYRPQTATETVERIPIWERILALLIPYPLLVMAAILLIVIWIRWRSVKKKR